jgi:hypothetical protein
MEYAPAKRADTLLLFLLYPFLLSGCNFELKLAGDVGGGGKINHLILKENPTQKLDF